MKKKSNYLELSQIMWLRKRKKEQSTNFQYLTILLYPGISIFKIACVVTYLDFCIFEQLLYICETIWNLKKSPKVKTSFN